MLGNTAGERACQTGYGATGKMLKEELRSMSAISTAQQILLEQ
jgi:hypothetical protein